MKVQCDKNELSERLSSLTAIVSAQAVTRPILQAFLLRAGTDDFWIEATDLDVSARVAIERVEVGSSGEIALPALRLQSLVRELPVSTIVIEGAAGGGMVDAQRLAVLSAEGYEFSLLGEDPGEFPEIRRFDSEESLALPREKFGEMLRRVSIAASRETGRYQLNGVFLEIESDKLTMTATDGKRLTHDLLPIENRSLGNTSAIIPNRVVDILIKLLATGPESIRLGLTETEILVDLGFGQLIAKLIEGAYPAYQAALPTEKRTKVSVRRADLFSAVRSASLVADRETQTIVFRFEGDVLRVHSKASDIGESNIKVPITSEGEPLEIRFNPVYFVDALRAVNEEQVRMEFCGADRPGVVRGGLHYRHLLVPLVV